MLVNQECFKTLKDFDKDPAYRKGNGKGGVYLWGFSLEDGDYTTPTKEGNFFPYYVGKHQTDVYGRTSESISDLVGGNKCSIFDIKKCAAMGTLVGKVHEAYQKVSKAAKPGIGPLLPDPNFENMLHFPEGVHRHYQFLDSILIQSQIEWMIKHFCILYFIPESGLANEIDDLEKVIGNLVGYDKLVTKPYNDLPGVSVEVIHPSGNIILNKDNIYDRCKTRMTSTKFGL